MATNRPEYRDARTPRAVKAYSIAQESRYLIVENVPALGIVDDLLKMCAAFGTVQEHYMLDDHPHVDQFTEVVWIKFESAVGARMAKRGLDDKPFFSNLLRISYAVEYETEDDIRQKLQERKAAVTRRLATKTSSRNKRKWTEKQHAPAPSIGPQAYPNSIKKVEHAVVETMQPSGAPEIKKDVPASQVSARPKRRRI
ncbi:hypothetical protein VTP01DRAFT_5903 [Rhizomucor pusillus]|uniref:uncharacterized protein n=1 Tax=Rhizomucor pusillus TaxID=4840 RepID=UPI003743B04A